MHKKEIYISLLNEGVVVARPALGLKIDESVFVVLVPDNFDELDEEWEFPPGTIVEVEMKTGDGGRTILLAVRQSDRSEG